MYKNYNMTQLTLPIETSVRIPQNDISRFVLMALNIRKIAAQRAVHYKIHIKKADFYQIINRNQLFYIA
ncbi:hypothetical protein E1E63_08710 [Staphylococcus aureus]|nr:hypothetical protein E1E63_02285 [Staphylococcus aureus]QCT54914.1 hypothetical protein E1E63_08710 [Staphylococcus aureus]